MIKKSLVSFMAITMLFAMTGLAIAAQEGAAPGEKGKIVPNDYTKVKSNAQTDPNYKKGVGDYSEFVQGIIVGDINKYNDPLNLSTHPQGTWNSPYSRGVDGYNYNDPQDYVADGDQVSINGVLRFTSGPHGGYLTSTHKCRECHAVHRAAGKFKLTRSDTRFEACDWCHGTGAGSGFNIQMDNDDMYTTEHNVGHTMGFGIESGKWKAPDDTYPAFTPNYWQGGFSCFDCHSPHANPARMMGFNDNGEPVGLTYDDQDGRGPRVYGIINPGHGGVSDGAGKTIECVDCHKVNDETLTGLATRPLYLSGSWLLVKNPDREIATVSTTVASGIIGDPSISIMAGSEIPDAVTADLQEFDTDTAYPVNKVPIDWNDPVGVAAAGSPRVGYTERNTAPHNNYWIISEFCVDCHDGNAGLHTVQAPLFSEDRALRNQGNDPVTGKAIDSFKDNYDLAYGHDSQPRHCARQMVFNPEDEANYGPHCRNCHKGSSGCGRCHSESSKGFFSGAQAIWSSNIAQTADNSYDRKSGESGNQGQTTYHVKFTSTNFEPGAPASSQDSNNFVPSYAAATLQGHSDSTKVFMFKKSRTVEWYTTWRTTDEAVEMGKRLNLSGVEDDCSDDGFSWPHRTLGWKMLKDDLFGLDFNGDTVNVGDTRSYGGTNYTVHDLDSVCLDCHNPTVWRATGSSHVDDPNNPYDDHNDELLTRGLP